MSSPHVSICTPEEAAEYLRLLNLTEISPHFSLAGFVDAVCREENGDVAWEVHQKNLVTDYGRRLFAREYIDRMTVFTSPSLDVARADRTHLADSTGQTQANTQIASSLDSAAWIRSWTTTFTAGVTRRIGTIGIAHYTEGVTASSINRIVAYTVLSPPKTQSSIQNLEVTYRLKLTPAS